MAKMKDGMEYDGIVESAASSRVRLRRQYRGGAAGYGTPVYGGLGTPGYGGYGGYGAGYGRPRRRFQRVGLPLALLTALSGLPYY